MSQAQAAVGQSTNAHAPPVEKSSHSSRLLWALIMLAVLYPLSHAPVEGLRRYERWTGGEREFIDGLYRPVTLLTDRMSAYRGYVEMWEAIVEFCLTPK